MQSVVYVVKLVSLREVGAEVVALVLAELALDAGCDDTTTSVGPTTADEVPLTLTETWLLATDWGNDPVAIGPTAAAEVLLRIPETPLPVERTMGAEWVCVARNVIVPLVVSGQSEVKVV